MLLSFKVMAMLTWQEVFCFENLQIAYCVNYRNVPGSWVFLPTKCIFCDCYRNLGHFLCGVEMLKCFVKVHLHCIVSNLKMLSKMSTLPPSGKKFCRRPSHAHVTPMPCPWSPDHFPDSWMWMQGSRDFYSKLRIHSYYYCTGFYWYLFQAWQYFLR